MSPFDNGSEIIKQEFKDSFKPSEQIRLRPSRAIAEFPYELYETDYIKLTAKSKLSSFSTALIGVFLVQCILMMRGILKDGLNTIEINDVKIILLLIVVFIISILVDFLKNKEKREINRRIIKYFKENKVHIDLQRKA